MKLCSKCNKRPAVVFISDPAKADAGPQGLCLVCAKELGIKPIDDMLKKMNISDEERSILFSGIERPRSDGDEGNKIQLDKGDVLSFSFNEKKHIDTLRIQFDMDFARKSVSPNWKMRIFAQKLHEGLDFVPVKVADTIVKDIEVYADDELIYKNENNYYSLLKIGIDKDVKNITVKFNETHGAEKINIYACDFI